MPYSHRPYASRISIHALREEGDSAVISPLFTRSANFYPRPPRGGRREARAEHRKAQEFLSTPSARRATRAARTAWAAQRDFYPRPPRGGRPPPSLLLSASRIFLSTPSARRATTARVSADPTRTNFYPRPPRGGRPYKGGSCCRAFSDFYPRPPRGGRQQKQRQNLYFQTNYTTFCTNLEEL